MLRTEQLLTHRSSNRRRKRRSRTAAAVTELAVCAPVLLLVSAALLELGSLIFLKQGLAVAAYEGAHRGVQPAATVAEVNSIANEIIEQRRINGASVSVTPSNIPQIAAGDLFTVRVTAPSGENSLALLGLFESREVASEVVVMKETEAR